MKVLHCDFNPNDDLYYCSLKVKYGSLYPELCIFILDLENLFNYIKEHREDYIYELPFLVRKNFECRLKKLV